MINNFRSSLSDADNLLTLFDYCVIELKLPGDYSDLLRMAFLYCLSALDKLIHDLILYQMIEIYAGRRPPTPKYHSAGMSFENHVDLANATVPPAEIIFENIVRTKLGYLSFMDPDKLADGLSLVWFQSHKWQAIATEMGRDEQQVKTELRNICTRRNAIVHEADRNPSTSEKLIIEPADAKRVRGFINDLGEAVFRLV